MKVIYTKAEYKDVTDTGGFEGLASVYGNVDLGGDVILPSAFKEFNYTKDQQIILLDGHNSRAPVGKGRITDTHVGLALKGQLNLKLARARDLHELMKDDTISGLSIGYDVLPNGSKMREDGTRELSALKLWEVSVVTFPMNPAARVSAVKEGMKQLTNIREYEDFLREVGGFSKAQASILAHAYKDLPGQREAKPAAEESTDGTVEDLLSFVKNFRIDKK